jgi:hypothetical protein
MVVAMVGGGFCSPAINATKTAQPAKTLRSIRTQNESRNEN